MSVLEQLAAELAQRGGSALATKDFPGSPVGPYLHGPNGLWSYPGLERPVISTRIKPRGIAGLIPARPSNTEYPLYPYLTGFTYPSETNPEGVCDDPPTAGQMKNCFQTATYGRYSYQTRVLDLTRLGQIINRGEFTDLFFQNDPLGFDGPGSSIVMPSSVPGSLSLVNDAASRFAELGTMFQNKLMKQVWEGDPSNNTGGGGYQEFPGLDRLISTGKRDAVTGTLCPTLDSLIVRMLRNLASRTGLDPVDWVFVMRETLFYELTAVWPCSYMTYRCIMGGQGSGASNNLTVDAGDAIQLRDSMRQGNFLVIDGRKVAVVLDDALTEETSGDTNQIAANCFASDIKILPLRVQGNKAALFWEYFDWQGPNAALAASTTAALGGLLNNFFWTDGGQYLWHMKPPDNWCIQWLGMIRPRLVLLTPHLAASINNIEYCPLMHPRDAFPDDPYYLNGGVTSRDTAPSWYDSWSA
jgi:hypothetical protein